MCDSNKDDLKKRASVRTIPIADAVGMVLAHDITEIRRDEFKGRAFRKGHVVMPDDICHLRKLGKEHLYVLNIVDDEMHEDDAALALGRALSGEGSAIRGEPVEGKITLVADRDGLLYVDKEALHAFNLIGDVMCATLHTHTVVSKGQVIAGTRAIPLVVKKETVSRAAAAARGPVDKGTLSVREVRRPKTGVVITGNEVYYGRVRDSFAQVIIKKVEKFNGEIVGIYYAPDDKQYITERLRELTKLGADLLVTTGGMSVDPDDVTRHAIRELGAADLTYGSSVLPGAMFLIAYLMTGDENADCIPVLGIPACGMYHETTILDLILPRVLAGEKIGRSELADLGHGGLCLNCEECLYPVCPFGK